MSKATKDLLDQLHGALAKELLDRINSGEAKPADLNAARQFLKDNGIEALTLPGSPLGKLAEALPFSDDDEESDYAVN